MRLWIGLTIVFLFGLVAIAAPWIVPHDPQAMSLTERLEAPSASHPLGLDENGTDVLSRLIFGSRVSLGVALAVVLVCGSIGLLVGSWAGYKGGWTDILIMRVIDIFHAFPGFLIALALVAVMGPSVRNLIFAICLTSWTSFARLVRAEVLHLKEREHVNAARAVGAGHIRLLIVHIWPSLYSLLIIQATFAMASTIIAESGLSFLGLGVPADTPTWGSLLNSGRRVLSEAPHISFSAGFAIKILATGFNLLGDGLRDFLDPRRAS